MGRLAVSYVVHDDWHYLGQSVRSFAPAGPVTVFVSRVPWNDLPGDWERAAAEAKEAGAEVVLGDWPSESEHRRAVLDHARAATNGAGRAS